MGSFWIPPAQTEPLKWAVSAYWLGPPSPHTPRAPDLLCHCMGDGRRCSLRDKVAPSLTGAPMEWEVGHTSPEPHWGAAQAVSLEERWVLVGLHQL